MSIDMKTIEKALEEEKSFRLGARGICIDIVLYGENYPIDVHGLIGERSASAIIAPIIVNKEDEEEVTEE